MIKSDNAVLCINNLLLDSASYTRNKKKTKKFVQIFKFNPPHTGHPTHF